MAIILIAVVGAVAVLYRGNVTFNYTVIDKRPYQPPGEGDLTRQPPGEEEPEVLYDI